MMKKKKKVRCLNCGAEWTEILPEGEESTESYSSPEDPKPCDCESQYEWLDDDTAGWPKFPRDS